MRAGDAGREIASGEVKLKYILAQRKEIAELLAKNGWQIVDVEDSSLEWWADEIWLIESVWVPRGFRLYLTFLVDPAVVTQRAKGQHVWAVRASMGRPYDRHSAEGEPLMSLEQGWRSEVAEFLAGIAELRQRAKVAASESELA